MRVVHMMPPGAPPIAPHELKMPKGALVIWVIYERPKDEPSSYVLRAHIVRQGSVVLKCTIAWKADDVETLRGLLHSMGLHKLDRLPDDDPVILETWL